MDINDRELLAKTLQAEAGNQGLGGMVAAGSVIMNRANTSGYGNGLRGVILKPGQFSAWNSLTGYAGGEQGQDMTAMRPSADAYKAADTLLSGGYTDPTGGATHYYNPSISQPTWGMGAGGDWKRIGAHVFGRADADRGGQNQEIASQTMRALGKQPQISTRGQPMAMPQQQAQMPREEAPKGILEMLGVQRRDPTAQGQGALPFYQRDRFADTMGALATGFNQLRLRPDENLAQSVMASQEGRRQKAMANKTAEWLAQQPRSEAFVQMLSSGADPAKVLQAYQAAQAKDDRTALMKNYEYATQTGYEGSFNDFLRAGGGGGSSVNIMPAGAVNAEDELRKKLMGKQGEQFAGFITAGDAAAGRMQDLSILNELAPLAPSGPLSGRLAEVFPEFNDVAALRQSIVTRLAPTMRVEGSGSTSDVEFNAMLNSFGSLKNTPEANAAITQAMIDKSNFDIARKQIVQRYSTDPNFGLADANAALTKLEAESKIPEQVRSILDRYVGGGEGATNAGATGTGVQWKVVE